MGLIHEGCRTAFASAIADVQKSFDAYTSARGGEKRQLPWQVNVKLYSELYAEARGDSGGDFARGLASTVAELKDKIARGGLSLTDASRAIVEKTLLYVKDRSPVIVIALMPPYYPYVANWMLGGGAERADAVCDAVIEAARDEFGDNYVKHCLVGMSDFSYFLRNPAGGDDDYIRDNMLLWGDVYEIPFAELAEVSMPIINIGPWGKGIHTYAERVFADDLYRRTPRLLSLAIEKTLAKKG